MSEIKLPPTETAEQRKALWQKIDEAGGRRRYMQSALRNAGFSLQEIDTSTLSAKKRAAYKAEKRAESAARKQLARKIWEAYRETHLVHLGEDVFYNDLVDTDRFDLDKRKQRLEQNGLPALENVDELAEFLKLTIAQLRWLSYHNKAAESSHYVNFQIPKGDGTSRTISAPKPLLKTTQRKIMSELLDALPIHGAAHGFVPGRSIATHAQAHAGCRVLVKMDIKDFFPSITQPRVKGMFRKFGYPEQVATILSLLCTDAPRKEVEHRDKTYHVALRERSLPQGAPTSPTLTNLLCVKMDRRLTGLANKLKFRYTRYADDLAFSWHGEEVPPIGVLMRAARKIILNEGFLPHPTKTKVLREANRQKLTGLIVNALPDGQPSHARVPRKLIRQIRAALYNRKQGRPPKAGETLAQLRGLAAFVHQSDPERGQHFLSQIKELEAQAAQHTAQPQEE